MSEDRIKVKDLATELGINTKDLLQTLRDLDIQARSTASVLSPDMVERVRERLKAASGNDVSRREINPGIIVRRRRATRNEEDASAEEAPAQAASVVSAPAESASKQPALEEPTPEALPQAEPVKAEPVKSEEKTRSEEKPREEKPRESRRAEASASSPARIIHRPQKEEPAPEPAPAKAEEAAPEAPTLPSTTQTTEESTLSVQTQQSEKAQARPARLAAPDASAMPEGSSAPTLPPRVYEADNEHKAAASSFTGDDADSGQEDTRRRKKKKRAPEIPQTPQVRIISRPSPEAAREAAENRAAAAAAAPAHRPGGDAGHAGQGHGHRDSGPGRGRPGQGPGHAPGQGQGQGQRPPRPGQGGTDSAPRPPRFNAGGAPGGGGGQGQAAGTGTSEAGREGQSKKKRLKGRRTVDFQQDTGSDFRRRSEDDDSPRLSRGKPRRKNQREIAPPSVTQPIKAAKRKIRMAEAIRVADMAHQMGIKSNEIIKVLFGLGVMATINQSLDFDTATLVAAEFEYEVEKAGFSEDDYLTPTEADTPEQLKPRPPVVTIMGHVDHGKTSLLDAIRKSNVTGGEAGGITQHIGAYRVNTKRGEIVFLDTPGHEAFTAMRARGAQVTDLVVLVVAADDGVMEQTREAINHSRAANVPIMVAVNKIDKPTADPDRVMRELAELGLQAEAWGGDTVFSFVSAKSRQGLDELLELIALQAEVLELKANPEKAARGHIVEAKLDKGRGAVATVLIQEGTLHQGDTFVCGVFSGKVRAFFNDQGKKMREAGPSTPVEVQGFDGVPEAGEEFICITDEKAARRIAETRAIKQRERELAKESKVTLETFLSRRASDQETLTLNLVLKADVQGSLEAITEALQKQGTEKVAIHIVHSGAGAITESDILLASASQAIIIGFNVRPTAKIKDIAESENVDIRFYDIIYKLVDDIKNAMAGLLAPVQREVYLGQVDVRETFSVTRVGTIAGCHVSDGKVTRNAGIRLLRDGVVVHTGKISSLKRFKDDVREVQKGYECGIAIENFNDIKVGDAIEAFEIVEEAATL